MLGTMGSHATEPVASSHYGYHVFETAKSRAQGFKPGPEQCFAFLWRRAQLDTIWYWQQNQNGSDFAFSIFFELLFATYSPLR